MNTSPTPLKLCTLITTPDGKRVECEIVRIIPDLYSLLPKLGIRSKELPHGIAIVPMTNLSSMKVTS